jgi:hypothetical protein
MQAGVAMTKNRVIAALVLLQISLIIVMVVIAK